MCSTIGAEHIALEPTPQQSPLFCRSGYLQRLTRSVQRHRRGGKANNACASGLRGHCGLWEGMVPSEIHNTNQRAHLNRYLQF
jgi:hypothetical protein